MLIFGAIRSWIKRLIPSDGKGLRSKRRSLAKSNPACLVERLETRTLLTGTYTTTGTMRLASDGDRDGVFETTDYFPTSASDRNVTGTSSPQIGEERPIADFSLTTLMGGVPLSSAALQIYVDSISTSTAGNGQVSYPQFSLIASLDQGAGPGAAAVAPGQVIGTGTVTAVGWAQISLDANAIQSFESQRLSIRFQNLSTDGPWLSIKTGYFGLSSYSPRLTLTQVTPTAPHMNVYTPNHFYDGRMYATDVSVSDGFSNAINGTTTIKFYNGSTINGTGTTTPPIHAGTYTVVADFVSSDPKFTSAQSQPYTFTISKALPFMLVDAPGGPYTGSAYAAHVTVTAPLKFPVSGSTLITYYAGTTATGTPLPSAPKDIGTYTVVATFTSHDADILDEQSQPVTFSIGPSSTITASAAAEVIDNDGDGVFESINSNLSMLFDTWTGGANGSHYVEHRPVLIFDLSNVPVGTPMSSAYLKLQVDNFASYPFVDWQTGKLSFNQFKIIAFPSSDGRISSSSGSTAGNVMGQYSAVYPGPNSSGTLQFSLDPAKLAQFEGQKIVLRIQNAVANDLNFGFYPKSGSGIIAPSLVMYAPATPVINLTNPGGVYDGQPYPSSATVTGPGGSTVSGTITYMYYSGSTANGQGTLTPPINAGTYTCVASFISADPDYRNTTSSPLTFTISKAPTQVTASAIGGAFSGNPFAATALATVTGGGSANGSTTFTYYSGASVSGTGSSTAPTTAGTYTAVASFSSSNPNFSDSQSQPVTFVIDRATPSLSVTDIGGPFIGRTYDASGIATGVAGAAVSGKWGFTYYVGSAVSGTGTPTAPMNAGTYTVVGAFTSTDPNYKSAQCPPLTFTISKSAPSIQVAEAGGPYTGIPYFASAIVTNENGSAFATGTVTYTYYEGTNASGTPLPSAPSKLGTYTVVASFSSTDPNTTDGQSTPVTFSIGNSVTIVSSATAVLTDGNNDGTFETVETGTPELFVLWNPLPPTGRKDSVLIFDLTSVAAGTQFKSAYLSFSLEIWGYQIDLASGALLFHQFDIVAFSTDGQINTASGSKPGIVLGHGTMSNGGTPQFSLDVSKLSQFEGQKVAFRIESTVHEGALVIYSTSGPRNIAPSLQLFTLAKPTVSLPYPGGAYDGQTHTANATVTGVDGAGVAGTLSYKYFHGTTVGGVGSSIAPIDIGTYTVVAFFQSSDPSYTNGQSDPVTFTIGTITPTVTVFDASGPFNGSAFVATSSAKGPDGVTAPGTTTYTYYTGSVVSGTGSSTAPTNVGTYTVVASYTSSIPGYVNVQSSPLIFSISPATPTLSVVDPSSAYTGSSINPIATAVGAGGVQATGVIRFAYYVGPNATGTPTTSAPKNVGTYTLIASFVTQDRNYASTQAAPVTFTITPATPTIVVTDAGGPFNGSPYPASATAKGSGGTVVAGSTTFTYYQGTTTSGAGSSTAPSNFGTYTVVGKFTSNDPNYTNAQSSPLTFTIGAAKPAVTVVDTNGPFKGWPFAAISTVKGVGGVTVAGTTTYTYYAGSVVNGAGTATAPTNVGTYTVVASFSSSDPVYTNAQSSPVTFTISPATPTISIVDPSGPYTGTGFNVVANAIGAGGVKATGVMRFAYYSGTTATGTASTTAPVNVGTYTVVASYVTQDRNYASTQSAPLTFAITPATPTVVVTDAGGQFNGSPYAASATVKGAGGVSVSGTTTFTYYTGTTVNGVGSPTAPTALGTYTVVGSFTSSNPNYANAQSSPVTFTIGVAKPTVTVVDASGPFNGAPFVATSTVKGVGGVTVAGTATYMYYTGSVVGGAGTSTAPANVGTYTVVASFSSSDPVYTNAQSSPVTFTISPATPTITVVDASGPYTGVGFNATATAVGAGGVKPTGVMRFAYYSGTTATGTPSTTAPKNVGTYTVVASFVTQDRNYANTQSAPVTFTINLATPTLVVTDAGGPANGSPYAASATAKGLGGISVAGTTTFTYYVGTNVSGTGTSAPPKDPGVYTVVGSFSSSDSNYTNSQSSPLTFTISKSTPTVVTSATGGSFNGAAYSASAIVKGIGGVSVSGTTAFTYYVGATANGTGTSTPPTNAGTFTVIASFTSSDSNYANVQSAPVTFTITKATPLVAVINAGGPFTGQAYAATATVKGLNNATVTGTTTFTYYTGSTVQGTGTSTAPVNAGTYTVVAKFQSNNSNYSDAVSAPVTFQITETAASKLVILQQPTTVVAGERLTSLKVAATNPQGKVITSDRSTVVLTITGGKFQHGTSTATAITVNGVATFSSLAIITAGSFQLTASDGSLTPADLSRITVNPAAASKLSIVSQPTNAVAGTGISGLKVQVTDVYGNAVLSDSSTLTATISSGQFADGKTVQSVIAVNGLATFNNLVINKVGTYRLTIRDGALPQVVTQSYSISAAAPSQLAIVTQPTTGIVGQSIAANLQVAIQDQFGNLAVTNTSTVTITLTSGKFANGSTSMTAAALNGTAIFRGLKFSTAGTYVLTISDGNLTRATSQNIVIKAS